MSFVYLASPYSHADSAVREQRYVAACKAAAKLMLAGEVVFSPIAHSHPIETVGIGEVKSGAFWKSQDMGILIHAAKLAVLKLPGWEESKGIQWEIETAQNLSMQVEFVDAT